MGNILSQQEPSYSQEEIDELLKKKQQQGDYAKSSDFINYVKKIELASYQPKGDYAAKSDLANYQAKGDYALTNHNHDADLKTKTMWCATGDLCEIPANKNVKFGGNLDIGGTLSIGGKRLDDYITGKTVTEDNVVSGLASNNTFVANVQKSLYDNQKTSLATTINDKGFRDTLVGQLKTDSEFLNKARGPSGSISNNTGFTVTGRNTIEFGTGVDGKYKDAGKIGYGTFDDGKSLNIVGAGKSSNNRMVRVWDNLIINGRNTIEFGTGVDGKYKDAGKIGYGTFDDGKSLNIVGAGTAGELQVKVFDDLTVVQHGNVNGNFDVKGRLTASQGWFPGGTINNPNRWGTHFPFNDGNNYIRGDTYINGDLYVNGRKI